MLFAIDVLKNFANFTGNQKTRNFIEKRFQHGCFLVKFANFLKTPCLQNISGGWFWTNPRDLGGSFSKGIFLSFSLSWLPNTMLNLLTKTSFDISLLFQLKYTAISLRLWTVNKPCYNDSLCLHEYTKTIGLKRKQHLFAAKKLKWFLLFSRIDIFGKCQ